MSTAARFGPRGRDRVRKSTFRPFAPQDQLVQEVYLFEDFLGYQGISPNVWTNGGTGGSAALATDNMNGVWQLTCANSNQTYNRWLLMGNQMFSARQKVTVTWRCKIGGGLLTNYYCEIGLTSIASGAPSGLQYASFCMSSATGQTVWWIISSNGSSYGSTNTGISANNYNWHEFELTIVSNTHIIGRIDRSPAVVRTLTVPLDPAYPSGSLAPYIWIQNVGKNVRTLQADYCEIFCDRS